MIDSFYQTQCTERLWLCLHIFYQAIVASCMGREIGGLGRIKGWRKPLDACNGANPPPVRNQPGSPSLRKSGFHPRRSFRSRPVLLTRTGRPSLRVPGEMLRQPVKTPVLRYWSRAGTIVFPYHRISTKNPATPLRMPRTGSGTGRGNGAPNT